MIVVTSTFRSTPGNRARVTELAQSCIEATRREKGCIRYELFMSTEDDVTLQFIEEWANLGSLRAHIGSSHLAEFKEKREPYVEKGGVLKLFDAEETSL